ncbi:hypothetical protein HDN1F_14900 [gamma proteobacterium HdN1]|nr:hypothetical protein HDN1F_14900 [gamma proteobacterium HdN1]
MPAIELTLTSLAIAVAVLCGLTIVLIIVLSVLGYRILRANRRISALDIKLDARIKTLEEELQRTTKGIVGVGKRLLVAERQLAELNKHIEEQENIAAAERNSRQAKRIIQKTIIEEEPTRNEARLAALLKGESESHLR